MYLSKEEIRLLDDIIKYFEVGFRTYIAENIISKYPTKELYENAIQTKKINYKGEDIILSGKISSNLEQLSKSAKVNSIYALLTETKDVCDNKSDLKIKEEKSNCFLIISELISLTYIFGTDVFSDLLQAFKTREEYMYLAEEYRVVRNNIEHPGANISTFFYYEVNRFIVKALKCIDDDFFWYGSKEKLKKKLDFLTTSVNNAIHIINNLANLPKQKYKFVCRTKETELIKTYLQGNELGMGRMHYVLISGFGGMGKTALITEVIMQMIQDYNNGYIRENRWFDFILFFTAKEEVLDVDGNNKIEKFSIKSQISGLDDIKEEVLLYLGTDDLQTIDKRGLIIIDNFETLSESEKEKINNYIIYNSKQEIQYVITSRNDEHVDTNYQLQLKAFNVEDGIDFINKYIEENNLYIQLSLDEKKRLVSLCKGNTIVLVLTLNRIHRGIELNQIERELASIGSETINNIVSFMAKNSFDEIYKQFDENEEEINRILQILILYEDPIDKYSLKLLSETDLDFVDKVVEALCSGLILEQHREEILINEYAKTYLIIKFKPNRIEFIKKQNTIREYKRKLSHRKSSLLDCRKRNPQIDNLLKEWQPNNIIDELAILEAFEAYIYFEVGKFDRGERKPIGRYRLKNINEYFAKIEETSTHPYIYAQKARIILPLLKLKSANKEELTECLEDSFERTIISVETQYTNIKGTLSYASILRELGRFYLENLEVPDYEKAANNSEKARDIYIQNGAKDKYYYLTNYNLLRAYEGLYGKTKDKIYLSEIDKLSEEILLAKNMGLSKIQKEIVSKRKK